MKKARIAIIIAISLAFSLFIGFLVIANIPISRIEGYLIIGVDAYSIKKMVSPCLYESYLLIDRLALNRNIESLAYIESTMLSFEGNKLIISCSLKENGVVLESGNEAFFYDGERLWAMDKRDVPALKDDYIVLEVDSGYLVYMERYGISSEFAKLLDSLFNLGEAESLITKAEFSNNSNIGSGILNLVFANLGAELSVEDLSKLSYLGECIDMISSEIYERRSDTIFSERFYKLKSNGLFRIKR